MSSSSSRRRRHLAAAAVSALALVTAACAPGGGAGDADSFPDDNIEIIVPFSAGGPTDTVTRLVADPMAEDLGVQTVVQNVEGAGGTIGAADAASARPDGYTLLLHHIGMATAPALYEDLAFDPVEDFKPIGLVTEVPMTIVGRSDFEPDTLEELFAYVRENEGEVTYANAGVGAASHLCGLLIEREIGADLREVPYDGTGPAMAELVGGQVDFMCDQTTNTSGQINGGKIKAYAVTTPERVESLPDLPTTAEAGAENLEITVWHALYAPKDTPEQVVSRLTESLEVALADDAVVDQMADLGTAPVSSDRITPDAVTSLLTEQIELWQDVIGGQG